MKKKPPYYNEAPKPVQEYYKKLNSADRFINKRDHIHYQALSTAMEELYEEGELRTDKLYNKETKDKFIDSLKDFFTKRYEKDTGIPPRTADSALAHYTGKDSSTLEQMMQNIGEEGTNIKSIYTLITHNQTKEGPKEYNETLKQNMYQAAGTHFEEKHLDDILEFLNKEGAIDRHINRDKMNLDNAKELLQVYRDYKSINKEDISNYYRERGQQQLPEYIKQHTGQVPDEGEMSKEMEETPENLGEKQLLQKSIENDELSSEELINKFEQGEEHEQDAVERALQSGEMAEEKQMKVVESILRPLIERWQSGEEGSQEKLENQIRGILDKNNNITHSVKEQVGQLGKQLEQSRRQTQPSGENMQTQPSQQPQYQEPEGEPARQQEEPAEEEQPAESEETDEKA